MFFNVVESRRFHKEQKIQCFLPKTTLCRVLFSVTKNRQNNEWADMGQGPSDTAAYSCSRISFSFSVPKCVKRGAMQTVLACLFGQYLECEQSHVTSEDYSGHVVRTKSSPESKESQSRVSEGPALTLEL